uniref:C-type lectin domain-containing protein n=1 Tax=Poecilia reticulata TaxID=8081 RepID=A0A3P9NVC3_POERE
CLWFFFVHFNLSLYHTHQKVVFSALSFVLVVCRSLATGQISSRYFFPQKPMPWVKGREYCQSHFVDLAVLNTEEEYSALLSAIPTNNASFWLGLHKKSSGWEWTDGEQLRLTHWYNYNHEGHCVSLEAMFEEKDKLLARYCNEQHRVVCQADYIKLLTFTIHF